MFTLQKVHFQDVFGFPEIILQVYKSRKATVISIPKLVTQKAII